MGREVDALVQKCKSANWPNRWVHILFSYLLGPGKSKFTFMLPLRDIKRGNIAKVLVLKVWQIFGGSEEIITDNAS
ncbi:hypothetical protein PR048_001007 [Dryococelus australis]|uniref:Transposase n=1 Tax=Dryococelus australis TaxID=614101 RepID=A0ABQ9IH43_9NEOP|nr:hypothetical protein PR048_001007 [Dryococelus australis]